jgi:hypothetical protein
VLHAIKKTMSLNRNTALLIDKSWKFEIYGLDENNNGIIEEAENNMLDCEADDVYTFYANGEGVFKRWHYSMQYGRSSRN